MNVLDVETAGHLAPGCSLIVGTVAEGGRPLASRGWGIRILEGEPTRVRLLVDADDHAALATLERGRPIAVTGADVRTLRSVQVKGSSLGVEPAGDDDRALMAAHVDRFYDEIVATDNTPRPVVERFTPRDVVAVVVQVRDVFDQTPGPGAGRPVGEAS